MSSVIPRFNEYGLLPPGDYEVTFSQLRSSSLVVGPEEKRVRLLWDSTWRNWLVDNLEILANQLWTVGITDIFVDGSFVEDKFHPNDIDGYFTCDLKEFVSGELQRKLNRLDPQKVWTWDPAARREYRGYPKRQLPMWHIYRVELYPHLRGMKCGIRDKHGHELEFPSAFRQCRRDSRPKGIVKIIQGTSYDSNEC